jgi:hypothetical protein
MGMFTLFYIDCDQFSAKIGRFLLKPMFSFTLQTFSQDSDIVLTMANLNAPTFKRGFCSIWILLDFDLSMQNHRSPGSSTVVQSCLWRHSTDEEQHSGSSQSISPSKKVD